MKTDDKKCPRCAETIKIDALVCRHCGKEFSATEIAAQKAAAVKVGKQGAVGCAVAVGLVVLIAMCSAPTKKVDPPASTKVAFTQPPLSLEQAEQLAIKNKSQIQIELKRSAKIPQYDIDARLQAYESLLKLAPANDEFARKRDEYKALTEAATRYVDHPAEALDIEKYNWSKGGFDNVQLVTLTVKNHASFAIKDFELTCVHQGPSGTDMDRNVRTIYEIIPAHGVKRVHNFNMGFIATQATSSRCSITDAIHG